MAACSLITASILIDCAKALIPGTGDTLYIFNKDEIAGFTFDTMNAQIVTNMTMQPGKKGFSIQGNRGSVEPEQTLDVQRYFKGYIHQIRLKVFNVTPTAKVQLELMKGGLFICIVEYYEKGVNGESLFELYGFDSGLELVELTRKPTDLETGGAYDLLLRTPERGREGNLPKAFWDTDEATTRANLAALL